jgi:hypothetical protein
METKKDNNEKNGKEEDNNEQEEEAVSSQRLVSERDKQITRSGQQIRGGALDSELELRLKHYV